MRKRLVAVALAGAVAACGGATAIDNEGNGGVGGSGSAPGSFATSSGGRSAGSGGAKPSGGTPGAGGFATKDPCPRQDFDPDSGCPATLSQALDTLGLGCDDGAWQGGCVLEGEKCGLVAARIAGDSRRGQHTCLYDAITGAAAGMSAIGRAFFCASYSEDFPPEGFTRGVCGTGSFDNPHD